MSTQLSSKAMVGRKPNSLKLVAITLVTVFLFGIMSSITMAAADEVAVKKIELNVDDCSAVVVKKTYNGDFRYEYSEKYYKLTTAQTGDTLSITLAMAAGVTKIPVKEKAVVYFPDKEYTSITVAAVNSAIELKAFNTNYKITATDSAASLEVARGFNKTINFKIADGTGDVEIDKNATNYTVNLGSDTSTSTIDLPDEFPEFLQQQNYQYKKGDGKAKINVDVKNSAFDLDLETVEEAKMETTMVSKVKYFLVKNETQLHSIGSKDYPLSGNYMLKSNIEIDDDWTPIGAHEDKPFTGIFNGNGFTISDVTIKDMSNNYKYLGFFGLVKGGTITNLTLRDVEIKTNKGRKDAVIANKAVAASLISNGKVRNCKVI